MLNPHLKEKKDYERIMECYEAWLNMHCIVSFLILSLVAEAQDGKKRERMLDLSRRYIEHVFLTVSNMIIIPQFITP